MEEKDQWYSVVDEAQLHSDERNGTYEDLQMRLCCPPLLYGRTMGLLVEVINFTTIRDSLGLTYDVSFELSLFDQLKLGWLAHVQTPSVLLMVLMRCLLIGIGKIWRTLIAKGSSGDNVPVDRFISLIEFYLTLLMVDLEFGKKGIEVLDIIVNQLRTTIDGPWVFDSVVFKFQMQKGFQVEREKVKKRMGRR
ncbi:hypothetical protein V6N13_043824 [Hibiscus sabdariffa]